MGGKLTPGRKSGAPGTFPRVSPAALPPYAIAAPAFRFRALAALAGRAPLGGPREVALACLIGARLAVVIVRGDLAADDATRLTRAADARAWLASSALPTPARAPLAALYEATARPTQGTPLPAAKPARRTRGAGSARAGESAGRATATRAEVGRAVADAIRCVVETSSPWLDAPSRQELARLADELGAIREHG